MKDLSSKNYDIVVGLMPLNVTAAFATISYILLHSAQGQLLLHPLCRIAKDNLLFLERGHSCGYNAFSLYNLITYTVTR